MHMSLQNQVTSTIESFFTLYTEWYRWQKSEELKESILTIAKKGKSQKLLMVLLDLYDQRQEKDWQEYLAFSTLAILNERKTIPLSFRETIETRILNAPTVVQRWWISCCKPIAIRHPEDCTPQRLTFLVELVDTIQDKEEDTELYYSNRVTIGRVFSQFAQQGIDLESVCPQLEKLYSDNVPGALFLSKALCIHNKRTGKEPEIRPLLKQLKKRAKGHCPNPVINYRRTLGKEEKGQSSKHIHWAHCAACLSQKVRLLYFNENDGWGYNDRIWEFRCLKCAKYTIYADT
jgi:hypothetical protein